MTEEKNNVPVSNEPEVVFNLESDRRFLAVKTEDGSQTMMEISGYDLDVRFNHDVINTVQDVESLLDGLKEMFRKLIMEDVLGENKSETPENG